MEQTQIPSGDEVYNALMGQIDTDLLLENIPHLDEKYAGETPEQKAARYKRYEESYQKYDDAFVKWITEVDKIVYTYKRDALKSAESLDVEKEASALTSLEAQLLSA